MPLSYQEKIIAGTLGAAISAIKDNGLSKYVAVNFEGAFRLWATDPERDYADQAELFRLFAVGAELGIPAEPAQPAPEVEETSERPLSRQYVDNGVRFLDANKPDWRGMVDWDRLNMASATRCVLSQVYEDTFWTAVRKAGGIPASMWSTSTEGERWVKEHGFHAGYDGGIDYATLDRLWRAERYKVPVIT